MTASKVNYAAFAEFLSTPPDELALLRFRELNIRNLLFYQAELVHLGRQLRDIEDLDARLHPEPEKRVNYRWTPAMASRPSNTVAHTNLSSATQTTAAPNAQIAMSAPATTADLYRDKMLEVRETLAKYNEALNAYALQEGLSAPRKETIKVYRDWLDREDLGASFLSGAFEDVWDPKSSTQDFVSFTPTHGLVHWIGLFLVQLKFVLSRDKGPSRVYSVNSSGTGQLARGVSVIISSTFPVLPIIILFFINDLLVRIGLILVFTAVFAAILVFGTKLEPDKVLAITTAIAALQVVFVGSTADVQK
ncbi:hypothetical protein NA57DRAFT_71605 [Rhizodiscina lignyota]|uniref:DUF6594 domain-containing protein n=1 Tax=Rhizodiscina lignyota TaxID=1504668 RepID=A0A9P4IQD6_9PEZI|nr:hypothetical protein NA57DRAFT_71605 [Rhizodiscina lignyota]